MFPRLLELGPLTVYSYGVLLAAAYLLALYYAVRRATALRPRRRPRARPRASTSSSRPWSAPSCCCSSSTSTTSGASRPNCGRWRGRAACSTAAWSLAFLVGTLVRPQAPAARSGRSPTPCAPGIALGHVVGRFGCLLAGCCYGKPTSLPVGHHVHRPVRRQQRRHAAARGAAPDAAVRRRRRVADPRCSCSRRSGAGGSTRAGRSGSTSCSTRISRFVDRVLPRRPARDRRWASPRPS